MMAMTTSSDTSFNSKAFVNCVAAFDMRFKGDQVFICFSGIYYFYIFDCLCLMLQCI